MNLIVIKKRVKTNNMSRNSVSKNSKLKIIYPHYDDFSNGYKLCEGEVSYIHGVKIVPYVIIYVNGDVAEQCDELLLPISKEMAIQMFRERYL